MTSRPPAAPGDPDPGADTGADARRRLEEVTEELLGLYEEINVFYTVSGIAAASADVAVAGRRILEEAVGLLEADVGFIVYTGADLKGEEPEPAGLSREACAAIASVLAQRVKAGRGAVVIAPFTEGSAVPRAPEAVVAAPLAVEGETLGLICLGRRGRGATFTAGDEKILSVLAAQAALVISQRRNLDLRRLAKNLEERTAALKAIGEIGREITSSLDLDRILRAVADLPPRVLGFDRCGVLVERGGRLRIRALSGASAVDRAQADVESLERLLVWVAGRGSAFEARAADHPVLEPGDVVAEEIGAGPAVRSSEEFRDRARAHFSVSSARSILAIPLADEQGTLGVIGLESARSDAVTEASREAAIVLAHQASVSIRNGRLYRELPFISVLEPMRRGRRRLASVPRRRLVAAAAAAGVLAIASLVVQWDLRVPGTFTLRPARRVEVVSRVRGVLREVRPLEEGDEVSAGEAIAWVDDVDWKLRHNEAEWRFQSARSDAARLEAEGRAADLMIRRLEAQRWAVEKDLLSWKIEQAVLRAPADGVLLTPRIRERTGELLDVGASLCTLEETSESLQAEIAVPESEADALGGSLPLLAVLKPNAFPEWDVEGTVERVRPAAEIIDGKPVLVLEARVRSKDAALRPGMTGEARVYAGRTSLAALALRGPYRFVRRHLWW